MKEHKIILTWEAIYDIVDAEVWIYDYFKHHKDFEYSYPDKNYSI